MGTSSVILATTNLVTRNHRKAQGGSGAPSRSRLQCFSLNIMEQGAPIFWCLVLLSLGQQFLEHDLPVFAGCPGVWELLRTVKLQALAPILLRQGVRDVTDIPAKSHDLLSDGVLPWQMMELLSAFPAKGTRPWVVVDGTLLCRTIEDGASNHWSVIFWLARRSRLRIPRSKQLTWRCARLGRSVRGLFPRNPFSALLHH